MKIYIEERGWPLIAVDCLVTFVIVTAVLWNFTDIHNAFCFLIGAGAAALLGFIFFTSVGFWIVSVIFSVFWAIISAVIAGFFTDFDPIWMWVIGGLSFIICMIIHAREKR